MCRSATSVNYFELLSSSRETCIVCHLEAVFLKVSLYVLPEVSSKEQVIKSLNLVHNFCQKNKIYHTKGYFNTRSTNIQLFYKNQVNFSPHSRPHLNCINSAYDLYLRTVQIVRSINPAKCGLPSLRSLFTHVSCKNRGTTDIT